FLGSDAYLRVKAPDVVESFHKAAELHGLPASPLSDNGAVFTGSYRGGKVLLEDELEGGRRLQELTALQNRPRPGPQGRVIKLLNADRCIRVIDLEGELIRELTLDPSRSYQPISPAYDVSDVPTHVSGMS